MPVRPTCRRDLLPLFTAAKGDVRFFREHLNAATTPFHTLSAWPDGSLRMLALPEVNWSTGEVRVVTTFGCHDRALATQLADFYSRNGLSVCEPRRTFVHSHVYSCRLLSRHSNRLLAAYTALAFEDATTGAPVLYVQYLAKGSADASVGSASVGDFLFEHMRLAAMECKPEAKTVHLLTQSVGYCYDPAPTPDATNPGAQFWRTRLRITERGLDYMCCLAAAGEVAIKEDCATMHRVFVSAPAPSAAA